MDQGTSSTVPELSNVKHENEGETEMEEDVLADYFEKSASAVRHTFARFEQDIARPAFNYLLTSFRTRPIRSTFIAFYLILSTLPVVSFIGFSIFIFATSVFLALATAVFFATSTIGFFGFWLAATLVLFLFVSLNLTLATLTTYLFAQLALRARTHGPRVAVSSLYADARAQLAFVGARARGRGRKAAAKPLHPHTFTDEREGAGEATEMDAGAKEKGREGEFPSAKEPLAADSFGEKVPGVPMEGAA
ncbi:hypothetical protein GSI_09282 [Ganoderma sinense ZZ0214-1]|uniref:Uncharacterized protein n=1 Tax=Ganoderma sinense ZZ0214-1 TaxID=1077348 RepID=A0A2G8S637_9APHY|nr:hypothetical protein GSI_09282 [Ganoderma sinense ZZ0214-1]